MNKNSRRQKGFTLLETMIATVIMSVGILAMASFFAQGLKSVSQTQIQYIAQQKAQEAMETIFTARDTRLLTSNQITNVSEGGVFLDGPQPLLAAGPDGLYGTADDDTTNPDGVVVSPGPDKIFGTADDVIMPLNPWMTRTIQITPSANTTNLKNIVITIQWTYQGQKQQYQIVSMISNYS
jgi:prepilin-type N-terminal cleavage/methylation domain-containing protein